MSFYDQLQVLFLLRVIGRRDLMGEIRDRALPHRASVGVVLTTVMIVEVRIVEVCSVISVLVGVGVVAGLLTPGDPCRLLVS